MACLELDDRILIIDVGLSFPSGDMPGIDLVLPDFDFVRQQADKIQGVVLTHGHEDHIGALPYLLREIAGSRSTAPRSRSRCCRASSTSTRWRISSTLKP